MEEQQLIGQAKQFDEKIKTIKSQFFSSLDNFKKYYVYYNKNPEVNEFQNFYSTSIGQLQSLSREMFLTTNNIDKSIEDLDKQMSSVSLQLNDEKNLNKELVALISNLEKTKNGSEILIKDSKTKYNDQYYKNVEIFIGLLIVSGLLSVLFKKKVPLPVPVK